MNPHRLKASTQFHVQPSNKVGSQTKAGGFDAALLPGSLIHSVERMRPTQAISGDFTLKDASSACEKFDQRPHWLQRRLVTAVREMPLEGVPPHVRPPPKPLPVQIPAAEKQEESGRGVTQQNLIRPRPQRG